MDDPEVSSKPRSGRIILEDDEEERGTCPDQEDQCSGAGSQTIKDLPFVCFPCANLLGEDVDSVHNDNDDGWTYTVKYDNFSELDICCTRCSISEHQRQIDTRGHCALCDRAACRECTALLRVKTSGPSSEGEGDACIVCRLCDHVLDINLGCLCVSERRYDFLMGNLDTTPRGISYAVVKGANDSFCGRDTEAKIFADSSDEASIATSCEEDGDCSETMDNVNLDANQTPAIHRVVSSQNVTAEQVEAPLSPSQKVTLVPEQEMTDVQLVPSSDVPAVPGAYSESSSAGLSEVAVAHIPTPVAAAAAQEYMGTPIKFSNRRKHSSHSFAEENLAASPSGSSTDSAINLSNSPSPFDRESKRTRRERARDMLAAGVVGSIVGGISMFAGLAALGASTD
ncbi:hypothetical protein K437DRAFT_37863 [Tilletiaria anomala UBC 951]|uniref:Uncharacterized protein n=1 Tax=Tilletiaria anomala (strain ATCC 24038 / CBS 436.72 / UBC 951) TaxID=1037660 RepID=A0A066VFI8_TILAU|nr:uncharacterized protein K437DRAFT_37863 [Tilletiaria anomala UBC 951]KDN37529.1 hypothetical protein K437DRAFT_37863 [Tilletiaria anomala UBC 951]